MKIVPSKCQVPKPIKLLEGIGNGGNGALIRSTAILWTNKWSTFHTFTIHWSLWETIAGWAPVDLYFMPVPVRIALLPNANFSLSDWSYW